MAKTLRLSLFFLVITVVVVGFTASTAKAAYTPTVCDSDINRDGVVNLFDFAILADNFFESPMLNVEADLNRDGAVNLFDFHFLQMYFFDQCDASASPSPSPSVTPSPTPTAEITMSVNSATSKTISPYIYGTNVKDYASARLIRAGGNRWTAYNWENNASNAGSDWNNSSDNYLCESGGYSCGNSSTPGEAVRVRIADSRTKNAASLITVPIVDYVAADKNGSVGGVASPSHDRWAQNAPRKPGAESSVMGDRKVYQDEFVNFIETTFSDAHNGMAPEIFYSLDNEPALWPSTHSLVHNAKPTYAEMTERSTNTARMIKDRAPAAKVFGNVSYGWAEFKNLQDAPDAGSTRAPGQVGNSYLDYYLASMRSQSESAGRRLVDVLDLHWYPEAQDPSSNCRITECSSDTESKIQARVQAPRSLWDTTYTEKSWISQWETQGPVKLIPDMKSRIANNYPGTELAMSEYNYGGGNHISGGIAQADVLGIFGREGLFAANYWDLNGQNNFVYGAFDMFLNYNGSGASVGNKSIAATTTDNAKSSVYAMTRQGENSTVYVIAINKTANPISTLVQVDHPVALSSAEIYQLTSASSNPQTKASIQFSENRFTYNLPAYSVTTFVLK